MSSFIQRSFVIGNSSVYLTDIETRIASIFNNTGGSSGTNLKVSSAITLVDPASGVTVTVNQNGISTTNPFGLGIASNINMNSKSITDVNKISGTTDNYLVFNSNGSIDLTTITAAIRINAELSHIRLNTQFVVINDFSIPNNNPNANVTLFYSPSNGYNVMNNIMGETHTEISTLCQTGLSFTNSTNPAGNYNCKLGVNSLSFVNTPDGTYLTAEPTYILLSAVGDTYQLNLQPSNLSLTTPDTTFYVDGSTGTISITNNSSGQYSTLTYNELFVGQTVSGFGGNVGCGYLYANYINGPNGSKPLFEHGLDLNGTQDITNGNNITAKLFTGNLSGTASNANIDTSQTVATYTPTGGVLRIPTSSSAPYASFQTSNITFTATISQSVSSLIIATNIPINARYYCYITNLNNGTVTINATGLGLGIKTTYTSPVVIPIGGFALMSILKVSASVYIISVNLVA